MVLRYGVTLVIGNSCIRRPSDSLYIRIVNGEMEKTSRGLAAPSRLLLYVTAGIKYYVGEAISLFHGSLSIHVCLNYI